MSTATPSNRTTDALARVLDPNERRAVSLLVRRILADVPAELDHATLFGSRARGDARIDSDIDVLLIFERLPLDREPHASIAEEIAEATGAESGLPVTVWSVSLADLLPGRRTPMLVDALSDSIPIWYRDQPLEPVPFTPADALRCASALLDRVAEGSTDFAAARAAGDRDAANRRARDDIVRLCTALLLLRGITRPRRAAAIAAVLRAEFAGRPHRPYDQVFAWAWRSFGRDGRGEQLPVPTPSTGYAAVVTTIDLLRDQVHFAATRLTSSLISSLPPTS